MAWVEGCSELEGYSDLDDTIEVLSGSTKIFIDSDFDHGWERKLSDLGLEVYMWSSDRWVLDIHHGRYFQAGFLATFDSELRLVNKVQASLSDWFERWMANRWSVSMKFASEAERLRAKPPEEPSEPQRPSYAVVVSAVILLAFGECRQGWFKSVLT